MENKDSSCYINLKFGNWTVLEIYRNKGTHTTCKVKCDCGNIKVARLSQIINPKLSISNYSGTYPKKCKKCPTLKNTSLKNQTDRENQIRLTAYYLWLNSGCPVGRDVEIWLEAEKWV